MSEIKIFEKMTVIGLGLIGSSICRAAKANKIAGEIIGYDDNADIVKRSKELSFIDRATETLEESVHESDIVILCTPVGAIPTVSKSISTYLKNGSILTDTGSVKGSVYEFFCNSNFNNINVIPSHPVAGTENSGPDSGFAELFIDRWCILTPLPEASKKSIDDISSMWSTFGSKVELMDPQHHDLVLAITSHLPHLISFNIVGLASDVERIKESEIIKYSAGGFRDFTRIASSDPIMWRDVFLNNKDAVLDVLGMFIKDLSSLQEAIKLDRGDVLENQFKKTKNVRKKIIHAGQGEFEEDKLKKIKN